MKLGSSKKCSISETPPVFLRVLSVNHILPQITHFQRTYYSVYTNRTHLFIPHPFISPHIYSYSQCVFIDVYRHYSYPSHTCIWSESSLALIGEAISTILMLKNSDSFLYSKSLWILQFQHYVCMASLIRMKKLLLCILECIVCAHEWYIYWWRLSS